MSQNRRKHKRFSATAFLNRKVRLSPLPPFFGEVTEGRLIDLSGGGLALDLDKIIPQGTNLHLEITFPDRSKIDCDVQVRHLAPWNGRHLHGFEFLNLPSVIAERIDRMSNDYIDCETRIVNEATEVCRSECAFFSICNKPEKVSPIFNPDVILELAFRSLDDSPLAHHP